MGNLRGGGGDVRRSWEGNTKANPEVTGRKKEEEGRKLCWSRDPAAAHGERAGCALHPWRAPGDEMLPAAWRGPHARAGAVPGEGRDCEGSRRWDSLLLG